MSDKIGGGEKSLSYRGINLTDSHLLISDLKYEQNCKIK